MKMTRFGNRLVMASADCINYAGIVKTLEKLFKRKLGPLPDTLQAGAMGAGVLWPIMKMTHVLETDL